jgi:hypothetical protein
MKRRLFLFGIPISLLLTGLSLYSSLQSAERPVSRDADTRRVTAVEVR